MTDTGACGSHAGYYRHRKLGEAACRPCLDAEAALGREKYARGVSGGRKASCSDCGTGIRLGGSVAKRAAAPMCLRCRDKARRGVDLADPSTAAGLFELLRVPDARPSERRGSTTERGYGWAHRRLREYWRPLVEAGGVSCCAVICLAGSRLIVAGDQWHLGHTADRLGWTGPEHALCNESDGGRRTRWLDIGAQGSLSWLRWHGLAWWSDEMPLGMKDMPWSSVSPSEAMAGGEAGAGALESQRGALASEPGPAATDQDPVSYVAPHFLVSMSSGVGVGACGMECPRSELVLSWDEVACPSCRANRPPGPVSDCHGAVLRVVPFGELEYVCTQCGQSCGTRSVPDVDLAVPEHPVHAVPHGE